MARLPPKLGDLPRPLCQAQYEEAGLKRWASGNLEAIFAFDRSLMTPRFRHIAACLALLALVGGSVVAPGLHQAAHGFEHAYAAAEAASQTDHVHTDGEGFTVSLDGAELGLHPCLLCLPQPKTTAAPPATPTLFTSASPFAAVAAQAAPAPAEAHRPIRGPPTVA